MKRCSVEGCQREYRARGLCATHYAAMRRAGGPRVRDHGGPCSVEGCTRPSHGHGLCETHYRRMQRTGTLEVTRILGDDVARFWSKVEKSPGCWLWVGSHDANGYGWFRLKDRMRRAHVVAFELSVGPVPDGLELDHLCRTPPCVNPKHLEPVTSAENQRRGLNGTLKTHCKRGHPLSGPNLYLSPSGGRRCRGCRPYQISARV